MFCDYCGTQVPDDAPYCTKCGAAMQKPLQSPMQTPANNGFSVDTMLKDKKQLGLLSWAIAAVLAVVMIIGYFVAVNTTLEDTPLLSMLLSDGEREEFRETRLEMKERVDDIREMIDDVEDFSSKDAKVIEEALERVEKMGENASLTNMKSAVAYSDELDEVDTEDDNSIVIVMIRSCIDDAGSEVAEILSGLMTAIFIAMLLGLAFSAAGGFLRNKGLAAVGTILSGLYGLIFCGIFMTILIAALGVALIMVVDKYKKA